MLRHCDLNDLCQAVERPSNRNCNQRFSDEIESNVVQLLGVELVLLGCCDFELSSTSNRRRILCFISSVW